MFNRKKFIIIVVILLAPFIIFYLLNFNFRGIFGSTCDSLCGEKGEEAKIPNSWLNRYEIELKSDSDMEIDVDKDGLNLLEEYNNSTNPLDADTDKDGYNDGKEVRDGYNPIGAGRADFDGDGLPDFWEKEVGLDLKKNDANLDNDSDGLTNDLEFAHLTNPLQADSDKDGFNDAVEISNGYDPMVAGEAKLALELKINKLGVVAPIIWSLSAEENALLEDLKSGVTRYPDTGIPGQRGNSVISGHSSNYAWVQGNYNYIFKDLNNLEKGDEIIIKTTQQNGKTFEYKYSVTEKMVVSPDDFRIFEETGKNTITLVTCWPLRTNWKRLIVKAEIQ